MAKPNLDFIGHSVLEYTYLNKKFDHKPKPTIK